MFSKYNTLTLNPTYSICLLIYQKPVPNLVSHLYKPLEPKVYPIMCYNGAPVLSRNGIYFSKAVRSYGNILLWGIVVVSAVPSPFIMILWHLGEDTLWEIPTQRLMPDLHTYSVQTHTHTNPLMHTRKCVHTRLGTKTWRYSPYPAGMFKYRHTVSLTHAHDNTGTGSEIITILTHWHKDNPVPPSTYINNAAGIDTCCMTHKLTATFKYAHLCTRRQTTYIAEVTRAAQ